MANVSHATLTGAQLHEPKGAASAALGKVYVADGLGSCNWSDVGTSSFTGMIADFTWPVVQAGWLELDGSDINTTTYGALYSVMTIQMNGTRVNGSPIITSLSSTANMRVGYFAFGTGITSGTTILSIDSGTQITLSGNASSTGTSIVVTSPWLLNTGTIRLPDVSTAGRYRRSRTATTKVGLLQADQNQAHTHSLSATGTTDNPGNHTHVNTLSDPTHTHGVSNGTIGSVAQQFNYANAGSQGGNPGTIQINAAATGIVINNVAAGGHTHTVTSTGTSGSIGGTEARPLSLIVMTCVKT